MQFLDKLSPYVHWAPRLSLAATFLYHGLGKFPPGDFATAMGSLALGWAVAITEVAAGVLLIAGGFAREIFTRLGGLLVIVIMVGAIILVHWPDGWGGMEFQVLMLATGLYFLARGNNV